jgi:hypothetical protein
MTPELTSTSTLVHSSAQFLGYDYTGLIITVSIIAATLLVAFVLAKVASNNDDDEADTEGSDFPTRKP